MLIWLGVEFLNKTGEEIINLKETWKKMHMNLFFIGQIRFYWKNSG